MGSFVNKFAAGTVSWSANIFRLLFKAKVLKSTISNVNARSNSTSSSIVELAFWALQLPGGCNLNLPTNNEIVYGVAVITNAIFSSAACIVLV